MLTTVTYHYVRDPEGSPWPGIKSRRVAEFEGQLDHIARHYEVCSPQRVRAALRGEEELPRRACLLTFDDGLREHVETVLPRLEERGLSAAFFATAEVVETPQVLDVHKLQFVLASTLDPAALAAEVFAELDRRGIERPPLETSRPVGRAEFDPPEVVMMKRLLQSELDPEVRRPLVDELFRRHVTVDEAGFAAELYCGYPELRQLADAGMEIGGHGASHRWLGSLPEDEQRAEDDGTVRFLASVAGDLPADWCLSYPGGSYNEVTIDLLADAGCGFAFTLRSEVAEELSRPLELPRLDTNDLPLDPYSPPLAGTVTSAGR